MATLTMEGTIENGQIRLTETVNLPDQTKVYLVISDRPAEGATRIASPRLVNPVDAADFFKQVSEFAEGTRDAPV